jgi:DNA (cytosine-5)-methyltransferase 3A
VALEKAGIPIEVYYASEIDKYAIQIAQKNYPDTIQLGSVVELVPPKDIDILIGGSPCQDLSIAKKGRKGLDGVRSGLFYEYVRILKEAKPKWFILENVASMPKEAKATITKIMGVEPIMINAALVSAQSRKRLFWTNIPNIVLPEDRGILLKDILEEGVPLDKYGIEKLKSNTIRTSGRGSGVDDKHNWDTIRIGHFGNGSQAERIYSPDGKSTALSANGGGGGAKTGLYAVEKSYAIPATYYKENVKSLIKRKKNGLMVKSAAKRGRNIVEGKRKDVLGAKTEQRIEIGGDKANTIISVYKDSMVAIIPEATKKGYAVAHDGDSVDLSFPTSLTRRGRVGQKAKNIMTSQNVGVFTEGYIRKLTPIECERLQCLPDNYTEGLSDSQRYKTMGNAFNVYVVAHILSFIPLDKQRAVE